MNQEHKDLLIAAAKAAGIKINQFRQEERDLAGYGHVGLWTSTKTCWNPITNLADRYDLARRCKLRVDWKLCKVRGETPASIYAFTPNDDESEALAILRAAVASKGD